MNPIPPTSLLHLSREAVQAYLDDLAALSVRYGIVVDGGVLRPRDADVGGYLLVVRSGQVRTYATDSDEARFTAQGHRRTGRRSRTMTADVAGITAHQVIQRLRGL